MLQSTGIRFVAKPSFSRPSASDKISRNDGLKVPVFEIAINRAFDASYFLNAVIEVRLRSDDSILR